MPLQACKEFLDTIVILRYHQLRDNGESLDRRSWIMRRIRFGIAAALALIGMSAHAELLYTTNGASISRFDSASTGVVTTVPVTGLQAGETLVGLDTRP